MLTLLGSLIGFASSSIPEGVKLLQDRADRKHELDVLTLQLNAQAQGHTQRLEEVSLKSDVAETKALYKHAERSSGVRWIEGIRGSVRPTLTYGFFILFAVVKISALIIFVKSGIGVTEGLVAIWDAETMALFAAIISFWFGGRALSKLRSTL